MARQNANGEKNMDGVEKAAILLIALGPEKSAQIFKHLKEDEIEQLTLELLILAVYLHRQKSRCSMISMKCVLHSSILQKVVSDTLKSFLRSL